METVALLCFQVQRSQDRAFQSVVTVADKKYKSSLWSVHMHTHTHAHAEPAQLELNEPVCVLREKSKKFAEQAAAIVCLRVLGVPEGRIGEEDSGLVCKRKRDSALDSGAVKENSKKRMGGDGQQAEQYRCGTAANGDAQGGVDTPPQREVE